MRVKGDVGRRLLVLLVVAGCARAAAPPEPADWGDRADAREMGRRGGAPRRCGAGPLRYRRHVLGKRHYESYEQEVAQLRRELAPAALAAVMGGNARRLFGLGELPGG